MTPNADFDPEIYDHISPEEESALLNKIKRANRDLIGFRSEILQPVKKNEYEPAPFHFEWSNILLYETRHFNIQAFRESGKSTYVIRSFPLYRLMFPDPAVRYICLVKRNQDLAGDKLLEIEREYKNNIYLKQNLINITEESASAFQLTVMDPQTQTPVEIRIEAHGKGPTLRGALWGDLRPQIIIIDDVQTKDDMDSDKILERDWQWFLDDVMFLSSYGRIFMISNNLGERCISERIMNTAGNFNFTCVRLARTSALDETGVPAWPGKDTQKDIIREYEVYRDAHEEGIWVRNCLCQCMSSQDQTFFRDQFQYYPSVKAKDIAKDCNVYIRMDTAVKDKKTSDYTAIVVAGISPENHTFVFDISYGHYSTEKKFSELFRLVREWCPVNVGIEATNDTFQFMQDIRKKMPTEKCFFRLDELKHQGKNKESRIELALQPRFASKTVWFPEQASWLRELEHELLMFTRRGSRSMKDDLIDAFSYISVDTTVPMRRNKGFNIHNQKQETASCEIYVS